MARPAKSTATTSKHLTKAEKKAKQETEEKLKGAADKLSPPDYLRKEQRKIFRYIVRELEASGILGNLDIYVLSACTIAIDRMQEIEKMINEDVTKMQDRTLMAAKDKYSKEFFRSLNELSLSPQSRAKLGNINLNAQKNTEDPLLAVLKGDGIE